MQQIITNFHKICLRNKVEIIGGDTTSSEKLFLSLTIIGDKINNTRIIRDLMLRLMIKYTLFQVLIFQVGYLSLYSKLKLLIILKIYQ